MTPKSVNGSISQCVCAPAVKSFSCNAIYASFSSFTSKYSTYPLFKKSSNTHSLFFKASRCFVSFSIDRWFCRRRLKRRQNSSAVRSYVNETLRHVDRYKLANATRPTQFSKFMRELHRLRHGTEYGTVQQHQRAVLLVQLFAG